MPLESRHGANLKLSEDAPIILQLIQELADYEKEPDANKATVESIQATVAFAPSDSPNIDASVIPATEPISPTKPARCLLLFNPEGEAAGMALYFYNYSTWRSRAGIYLEDLYVRESARGKGYGKKLLSTLAKQVLAIDGAQVCFEPLHPLPDLKALHGAEWASVPTCLPLHSIEKRQTGIPHVGHCNQPGHGQDLHTLLRETSELRPFQNEVERT